MRVTPARRWGEALLGLLLATAIGVGLARMLLTPRGQDLRALALYLVLSGAASLLLGAAILRAVDRLLRLRIRNKIVLAGVVGSGVGLVNVFVISELMFLSELHDLRLLVTLLIFSELLTTLFSVRMAGTTASQIESAAAAVGALAHGDYRRVELQEGGGEAGVLGRMLNELADRLQAAEQERAVMERERREWTAAASHDLRTPLSSLRAMVDALEDEVVEEPAEVRRYYGTMRREIERLGRLVDDLFELARMDAGALKLNKRMVSPAEIASEVTDAMRAQSAAQGIELSLVVLGEPRPLSLDGSRIERALGNLVRNAFEHTPAGGRVTIEVSEAGPWVRIQITDTGTGISPADIERIWDRFYRAERSRARPENGADGAGLGLAIVRGIVEAHGGHVQVSTALGNGAQFTLHLPFPTR
jgi:two-component system, OmpR family, sensor histidine kinase SaeS